MNLNDLGWNNFFNLSFQQYNQSGCVPARIARQDRQAYFAYCEAGDLIAELSGKMRYEAADRSELPTVGDWVAINAQSTGGRGTIQAVLPRKSCFSRKVAGFTTEEQALAANVDTVFLVTDLDSDFNLRRSERYLTVAWDSGAVPVVLLNKADLCDDVGKFTAKINSVAFGVPIYPVSAARGDGLESLNEYLTAGSTIAFLGSSGVGKSTLINRLLGTDRLKTRDVRSHDGRGRHTTTWRELILLPNGAAVIDTPGLREVQLWTDEDSLGKTFDDVEVLSSQCRFRDCSHIKEPGCAVREAIRSGRLDPARLKSFLKMQKELRHLSTRKDQRARLEERDKWKKIAQWSRRMRKNR
ncbi:MAG: ribosome small subunit-dependent GTPase A [Candidatus Zixiibacteriota bacterium]|nr:MAG: ribosome small subunit-dependent GTPase A [candidate division Zixibacteria bacterium]